MMHPRELPPPVMKLVLGNHLARLREAAGKTQVDSARVLGCTQQKIAHIERGSGIRPAELDALLDHYGVGDAGRAHARQLRAESGHRTKRGAFSTRFPQHLRLLVDMESSCDDYRSYQSLVVPVLLQTDEYMRVNARAWRPSPTPDVIDEDTANRLARQRVLDNLEQRFWFIIDEAALRRNAGGPAMRAQLLHLVAAIDRPNVEVRVVPFGVGCYMGQGDDYTIFGYDTSPPVDVVHREQPFGGEYVDDDKRTSWYSTMWEHQKAAAGSPEQTRRILRDVVSSL